MCSGCSLSFIKMISFSHKVCSYHKLREGKIN
jgi:hypothetical protein